MSQSGNIPRLLFTIGAILSLAATGGFLILISQYLNIPISGTTASAAGVISCAPSNATVSGDLTVTGTINSTTIKEGGTLLSTKYQEDISPNACGPNQFATQIADTGALTCSTVSWSQLSSFPAACGVGTFVQGVGPGDLTCVAPSFAETDPKVESWAKSVVADCSATQKLTKSFGSLVCALIGWTDITGKPGACGPGDFVNDVSTGACASPSGTSYWTQSGSNLYPNNTSWNVGIGTSSPTPGVKLDVAGSIKASAGAIIYLCPSVAADDNCSTPGGIPPCNGTLTLSSTCGNGVLWDFCGGSGDCVSCVSVDNFPCTAVGRMVSN